MRQSKTGSTILYVVLAILLEAVLCVAAFVGTTWFLSSNDQSEAQEICDGIEAYDVSEHYISYEEYRTLDGTRTRVGRTPLISPDADLSERQYENLCRVYDEAKQGNMTFKFCDLSVDEISEIMDAIDFTYSKANWESREYPGGHFVVTWNMEDCETVENLLIAQDRAREALAAANVTDGMLVKPAVLNINEYLCNTVEYDETYAGHRAVDAFDGSAVCSGYSEAFQYMCLLAGIPCEYVHGTTAPNDVKHAWNRVNIDGEWLYIDVTNNDARGTNMCYFANKLWNGYTISESTEENFEE